MCRSRFFLVFALLSLPIQLSCGYDLNRRVAAEILSNKIFPKPVPGLIRIGERSEGYWGDRDYLRSQAGLKLWEYQKAGVIQIENMKVTASYYDGKYHDADFFIELTPEGKRHVLEMKGSQVTVRLCSEVLGEITGIAFSGDKSEATVQFFTLCSEVTPFGRIEGHDGSKPYKNYVARMQLYDDGWRFAGYMEI
jgi:hypothetical protein